MKEFIHIGYPKNLSTSLQRDYFSKHEDIYYLGIGHGDNLGYRTPMIESAFEVYLKTAKAFHYQERRSRLIAEFENQRKAAVESEAKAFGLSSEHLSFSFSYDSLDLKTKMSRVNEMMASPQIILIIRNQGDLIKSLFKESIRVGLTTNFEEYLYLLYKYQDRNYLYDLRYDVVMDCLIEIFGKENVHLLNFETYMEAGVLNSTEDGRISLIRDLSGILGVSYPPNIRFGHHNEALSESALAKKLELNRQTPHDLGNHLLESAEKHRIGNYLKNDLGISEAETEQYEDVLSKRALIKKATALDTEERIDFSCDPLIKERIVKFYREGNRMLQKKYDVKLSDSYFDITL